MRKIVIDANLKQWNNHFNEFQEEITIHFGRPNVMVVNAISKFNSILTSEHHPIRTIS